MTDVTVLEPAIDPANKMTFLLDWELTLKCNLDCSYCTGPGYPKAGHDNSTDHPPLSECLDSIDFMFEYVDLYMQHKPKGLKYVVLNVYGGESLYHPNIVEILKEVHLRYEKYKERWPLAVTTTTNAIVSAKTLNKIIPLIDEFTVSYHTETTEKQRKQVRESLLAIQKANKRLKCIVLMHNEDQKFLDAHNMVEWLKENNIRILPRPLEFANKEYKSEQIKWFNGLYKSKTYNTITEIPAHSDQTLDISSIGRACCGGRQVCEDQKYKERKFFVSNVFPDWYCSVNEFFLHIKQVTREVFVNKDCKMDFNGNIGPIGYLDNPQQLLDFTKDNLANRTMPIIQCKKHRCICGLCAPKAKDLETFKQITEKYKL